MNGDLAHFELKKSIETSDWTPAKFRCSPFSSEDFLVMSTCSEFYESSIDRLGSSLKLVDNMKL